MLSDKTKTYTGGITMSQIHCNLKSRKNKHLNERERYKPGYNIIKEIVIK